MNARYCNIQSKDCTVCQIAYFCPWCIDSIFLDNKSFWPRALHSRYVVFVLSSLHCKSLFCMQYNCINCKSIFEVSNYYTRNSQFSTWTLAKEPNRSEPRRVTQKEFGLLVKNPIRNGRYCRLIALHSAQAPLAIPFSESNWTWNCTHKSAIFV